MPVPDAPAEPAWGGIGPVCDETWKFAETPRELAGRFDVADSRAPPVRLSMRKIRATIVLSIILISPAFAHDHWQWGNNGHGHDFHAAPGPIAGAGLPFLAVGYGAYWLVKRRRRKPE